MTADPARAHPAADRRAQWLLDRARVARHHHPDRGGDVEVYLRALAEVDRRYNAGTDTCGLPASGGGTGEVAVHRDPRLAARMTRVARRTIRLTRAGLDRLPHRIRRGKHYIEL